MENDSLFSKEFIEKQGIQTDGVTTETTPQPEGGDTGSQPAGEGDGFQPDAPPVNTGETPPAPEAQTPDGEPPEGQTPEGGETPPAPEFNIEPFNKFFETELENTDQIKSLIDSASKVSDYEDKVAKITEFETTVKDKDARITELEGLLDPMKYFSSPDSYKAEALKMQMPDKDPVMIEKVIKSDHSKSSDLDVLIDKLLLETPAFNGDRARAERVLKKKYGIDAEEPAEEWDQVVKDEMLMDGDKARKEFKELADKVELPEVISPEDRAQQIATAKAELKASWEEPINRIAQYEKEVFKDAEGNTLLEFEIPESSKEGIKEFAAAMVESGGLPVNEDTLRFIEGEVRKNIIVDNLTTILNAYGGQLKSQWQEQKDAEEGNTTPPNTQTTPPEQIEENTQGIEKMLQDMSGLTRQTL